MNKYCIVSDATLDLPADIINKYEIPVIPMDFQMGSNIYTHYPDEREMSSKEFYENLRAGVLSITSQINPAVCEEFFTPMLEQGMDIIYIAFSSGLSGTYNTGRMVIEELKEKYPERKIKIVDSLCASIGEGLLVYLSVLEQKKGKPYEEMIDYIEKLRTRICHWFTVEDLIHLKRGGRLSSIEAIVGTALKICPILSINEEGKLHVVTKIRGNKKALDYLVKRMHEDGSNTKEQTVIIGHSDCRQQADVLAKILQEQGLIKDAIISNIGPVIGSHTGAGMCALTFVGENYCF